MKKISCTLTTILTMMTFNQAHAQDPIHDIFPEYICVHEVTNPEVSRKQRNSNVSVKTYAFAYINEDMTCPPFTSDYQIPENEITYTGGVVWDIDEDIDGGHIECEVPISPACADFDPILATNQAHKEMCKNETDACVKKVLDTDHDCRPGLMSAD